MDGISGKGYPYKFRARRSDRNKSKPIEENSLPSKM